MKHQLETKTKKAILPIILKNLVGLLIFSFKIKKQVYFPSE